MKLLNPADLYHSIIGSGPLLFLCLGMALIFDYVYPFHYGVLLRIHPVHTCYVLARTLIRPYASRFYGIVLALACLVSHVIPVIVLFYLAWSINGFLGLTLWFIATVWFLKTSFSIRLLVEIALRVYHYARIGDWLKARIWAQQLVRRNVFWLSNEQVLSATIESLAESLVDGIVSPILYYPFLGVLGPYIQRLINTLDGAVGFKTPELREQGWFSAKLDTIVNYIPARLSAIYIILSALIRGYDWRNSFKTWLRDHDRTTSINAGHPMSAIAGALRVELVKPGEYRLGNPIERLKPEHIASAIKIILLSTMVHLAVVSILIIILT